MHTYHKTQSFTHTFPFNEFQFSKFKKWINCVMLQFICCLAYNTNSINYSDKIKLGCG